MTDAPAEGSIPSWPSASSPEPEYSAREPRAPRPELRFAALRKLAEAGLNPGISIAPLLPMINDSVASIEAAVAQAAKAAGVTSISSGLLFMKPTTRMVFLPWLEANFPHLLPRYLERYASGPFYVAIIATSSRKGWK